MKLVNVHNLMGDEELAVPVVSDSNVILIQSDTVLKDEYIDRLHQLNIRSVYIKDKSEQFGRVYKVDETKERSKKIVKKVFERHIYKHNEDLKEVGDAAQEILNSVIEDPDIITNITEIRNFSTDMYSHCINVCALSTIMALRLKMTHKQTRNVAVGAILHDIGLKFIQAPYMDSSVYKLGLKDATEFKKHTVYGYSSLEKEKWLTEVSKEIILYHHEHVDGSGFPFMLKGDKLRTEVKLVSVCSDFDSLVSGVGAEQIKIYQAIEFVKVHAGSYYDNNIVNKLLETIAVYPIGMRVLTNENEVGVVIEQNKEMTDRPIIKMLIHSDGSDYNEDVTKDLGKIFTLFIVDTL